MRPEEIAARFDATWEDWAVIYGPVSGQYVAFPLHLGLPREHQRRVVAYEPEELERRMALVQAASWLAAQGDQAQLGRAIAASALLYVRPHDGRPEGVHLPPAHPEGSFARPLGLVNR